MSDLEQQDSYPTPDLAATSTTTFTAEEEEMAQKPASSKKKVTISTVYDAPRDGGEVNISALGASIIRTSGTTVDSNIISNRSPSHRRGQSGDSDMIEKTEHINRAHIGRVFRGSTTVGTVNMEQIERIRISE